jgi:hypothetical protein
MKPYQPDGDGERASLRGALAGVPLASSKQFYLPWEMKLKRYHNTAGARRAFGMVLASRASSRSNPTAKWGASNQERAGGA